MQALAAGGVIQVIDYGVNLRRANDAVLRVAGGVLLAEGLEAAGMNIAAAATDSVKVGAVLHACPRLSSWIPGRASQAAHTSA